MSPGIGPSGLGDSTAHRHAALLAVLAVYVALALGYNLAVPVGESPDEPSHLEYAFFLRDHRRLPVPGAEGDGVRQAAHPPLVYALGALVAAATHAPPPRLIDNPHFTFNAEDAVVPNAFVHGADLAFPFRAAPGVMGVHWMRLVSLVAGVALVVATYLTGLALWPATPWLAWCAAAMAAFLPGFMFLSGTFQNDTLAGGAAAVALLMAVKVAQGNRAPRRLVGLGAVIGLAMLAKMTTAFLLPVAGLAVAGGGVRPAAWRGIARDLLLVGAGVAGIWGWWLIRSVGTYGVEDPLGWGAFVAAGGPMLRRVPLTDELEPYLRLQFTSLIGAFGWRTVLLPGWVYRLALIAVLVAGAGVVRLGLHWRRLAPGPRLGWGLVVTALGFSYASSLRLATAFDLVVAQGRYLVVGLSAMAVLFVGGLMAWVPASLTRTVSVALAAAGAAFSAAALFLVVVPAFRPPSPVPPAALAGLVGSGAEFGGRVRLVGYGLSETDIRAGEAVSLALYWEGLAGNVPTRPEASESVLVFVHVLDVSGEVVARQDMAPFEGRYPVLAWRPGQILRMPLTFRVSPEAVEGPATILVGLYPEGQPWERLPAFQGSKALGDSARLGPLSIGPPPAGASRRAAPRTVGI